MESKADTKLVMTSSFCEKSRCHWSGLEWFGGPSESFPNSAIVTWNKQEQWNGVRQKGRDLLKLQDFANIHVPPFEQ